MNEADSIMELHADSALHILQSIDSAQIGDVSQQAKYSLLMTQARVKNNLVSLADTAALPYLEYCYRHGTDYDRMRAAFYKSEVYATIPDNRERIKALLEAENIALHLRDDYWFAKIYEAKGILYIMTCYSAEAEKNIRMAMEKYRKTGRFLNEAFLYIDLATISYNRNEYQRSLAMLDSAEIRFADQIKESDFLRVYIQDMKVTNLIGLGELAAADSIDRISDKEFQQDDVHNRSNKIWLAVYNNSDDVDSLLCSLKQISVSNADKSFYYSLCYKYDYLKRDWEKCKLDMDSALYYQNQGIDEFLRQSVISKQLEIQTESNTLLKKRNKVIVYLTLAVLVLFITAAIGYRIYIKIQAKKKDALVDRITAELAASEISFNDYKRDAESRIEGLHNDLLQAEQRASCIKEELSPDNNQIAKLQDIYASRIDILSSVCLKYIDSVSSKDKEHSYETILKILGALSSKEAILEQVAFVNNFYDGLLYRFKADFPKIYRDNLELLVLLGTGMRPRMIAAILHKPDQTIYTKRKRIAKEIADSSVKDKDEYLSFFRM